MELKDFFAVAFGKTGEIVERPMIKAIDVHYCDKMIVEEVRSHLLKKYGNEVYYNDLDSYITANNVIESLIPSIRGEGNLQPRVVRAFKNGNTRKFLRHNPRFKKNKVVVSRVSNIFEEIFDIVHAKVLNLDPHSDLGKIQQELRITGETLSDENQVAISYLVELKKMVSSMRMPLAADGVSGTATENVDVSSEILDSYTKRIKEIETEYQNKHFYHAAITHYYALFQDIVTKLAGNPQREINKLICAINCDIALCQSNLGLREEALKSLSAIPIETASESKEYHFVYALIHAQPNDINNYQIALEHINVALTIDSNYHNAFSLKQLLLAHIYPDQIEQIMQDMDAHYCAMVTEEVERSKLAEHYQFRGLINLYADRYSDATEDFQQALEYGCEPISTKLNLAITMYAEASKDVPKDCRLLTFPINPKIMLKAEEALKEIVDLTRGNTDLEDIRKRAVSLYVSACSALGKKHRLSPISDYVYEGQDYEELRGLLLGASEKVPEAQLSLLSPEDRLFFDVRDIMEQKGEEASWKYIVALVDKNEAEIPASVYHLLLQLCLINRSSDSYWKYRCDAEKYGIVGELLEPMDACADELDGDIAHAKEIFDKIAVSSVNANILEDALRFFLRNEFSDEARALFVRMHKLIVSKSIYVKDAEPFYGEATRFFIAARDNAIRKILSELTEGVVSPRCKAQLLASFYSATNDTEKLYDCLSDLNCAHSDFANTFNMALCAARLFRYKEALRICYDLEKRVSNTEEKVKLFWLISDILLLINDKDGSFNWAKKAHVLTNQNPYDRSHQAFFSRAFRCNHHEAINEIVEYQKVHPVVVNWIKAFSIREDDENIVASLKNAIHEIDPNHTDFEEHEEALVKAYRQGMIPIHTVWERYNRNLWQLFDFASKNKLNIAFGHPKIIVEDSVKIGKEIVVDALTLVLMAYHNCISALDSFEGIYVNCGSVATIQRLYLSYEYPPVTDVLDWFESANNIIFQADGFVDEENQIVKLFSADFVGCCNIAVTLNVPFLYCDVLARKLQTAPESGIRPNVELVSIPSVCSKLLAKDPQRLSDVLYSLLKNTAFICFNAETILYQIRKQNYAVSKDLVAPFMICNTSCNMQSFANVYLAAIKELNSEKRDAAYALACIVLEDALRIWKQGTYYRFINETYTDLEAIEKAEEIKLYARGVLRGIKAIFEDMRGTLANHFDELTAAVGDISLR